MNTKEIESLLEKFYEGNTTLHEERILREFFTGKDVPDYLKSHQGQFTYAHDLQKHEMVNDVLEKELFAKFEQEQEPSRVVSMRPHRSKLGFIFGIAASILLLVGLFATLRNDFFKSESTLAVGTDPAAAYNDVHEALLLVSGNLNSGLKQAERLQMLDKAMTNVQLFNKFYQYQTIIINPDDVIKSSIKSK